MGVFGMTAAEETSPKRDLRLDAYLSEEEFLRLSNLAAKSGKSVHDYVVAYTNFVMAVNENKHPVQTTPLVLTMSPANAERLERNVLWILLREALNTGFFSAV